MPFLAAEAFKGFWERTYMHIDPYSINTFSFMCIYPNSPPKVNQFLHHLSCSDAITRVPCLFFHSIPFQLLPRESTAYAWYTKIHFLFCPLITLIE